MIIITWNVVTVNFAANPSLLSYMREQMTELEQYLQGLPPDSAHLLVELTRNLKTDDYTAMLSLRLQTDVLHSEQSAKDVKQAFDGALKKLANQLAAQKPAEREAETTARFSDQPMAAATGPQSYKEMMREQNQRQQQVHR
jgi:ribosomal subunit interface protein